MFVYKTKIIDVKKITFANIDRFLFFISLLFPERKEKEVLFKQTDKRVFKFAVKNIIILLCDPVIKPVLLSQYMYCLSNIVNAVKLYEILEKVDKTKEKNKEQVFKTDKGEEIYKSDYTKLYIDGYYKAFIRYGFCFESEFKNNIGFLEYEEIINELEKNKQENILQNIFNVGCGFSGGGESVTAIQKNLETLSKYGFDEKRFRNDLLGIGEVKNG